MDIWPLPDHHVHCTGTRGGSCCAEEGAQHRRCGAPGELVTGRTVVCQKDPRGVLLLLIRITYEQDAVFSNCVRQSNSPTSPELLTVPRCSKFAGDFQMGLSARVGGACVGCNCGRYLGRYSLGSALLFCDAMAQADAPVGKAR